MLDSKIAVTASTGDPWRKQSILSFSSVIVSSKKVSKNSAFAL